MTPLPAPPAGHAAGTVTALGLVYYRLQLGTSEVLVRRKYLPGIVVGDIVSIGAAIPRVSPLIPWAHVSE